MTVEDLIAALQQQPMTAHVFVGDELHAIDDVAYRNGRVEIDLDMSDDGEDDEC